MIESEFNVGDIVSVDFGVRLRSTGQIHAVPVNHAVQSAMKAIIGATVDAFSAIEGEWQRHDISEDYGTARKVYAARQHELMLIISELYDAATPPDLANLDEQLTDLDYYFSTFRDRDGRKAVGIKKATQFKATLGAQNRLVRLLDGTFVLIEERVLKLDQEFDAIVTDQHVFMLKVRSIEQVAEMKEAVARAAQAKIQQIHDAVPFLDLSRIKEKIERHPKLARMAHAIAERADLALLDRHKVESQAIAHGVHFRNVGGRLLCNAADEAKLMEVLDYRRYHSDLTEDDPIPFRASARQQVQI
jgi:hypothetical protein